MTSPSSAANINQFDTEPLSWVMAEIREALSRSRAALTEALNQDEEIRQTALLHATTYLHQAHGALQIVDVDGLSIITETVEDLFVRLDNGTLELSADLVTAIDQAYQALIEYLEELLTGAPHQPVRLFPYYRALLELRHAERIHPADLFFPNLTIRPQLPAPAPLATATDYLELRRQFERALLPFLQAGDPDKRAASAQAMRTVIEQVEQAQINPQSRGFWWVLQGFADVIANGESQNELYVKQLFARINLQIRRLSEGSTSIAERLQRDALFFIARAEHPPARAQQIRSAYRLNGQVPADYEKRRYGQVNPEALATARERLTRAKASWNRIASGDGSAAQSFELEMSALTDAAGRLNSVPLSKLMRELNGIARPAAYAPQGDRLSLEMATSLLFVENALAQISHLPDNFAERADAMSARLLSIVAGDEPESSAQWLNDMAREAQQRQTMTALAGELQTSLRQVEKMLEEYFQHPQERGALPAIDHQLHQISGALAILDQDDALAAVEHTRSALQRFGAEDAAPQLAEFQQVARNIGALSFFIETLQLPTEGLRKRFEFDAASGIFHANLIDKNQPAEVDETLDGDTQQDVSATDFGTPPLAELPTVEDDLARKQQQSADLALSLSAEPDNPELQEQLKQSLAQVRLDAALVDNPEANDRAQAVIDMLDHPDFVATENALAEIALATAAAAVSAVEPAAPVFIAPTDEEAIDAELMEIFLTEAVEVLDCVQQVLPDARNDPYNQMHTTTLRRSFHTLKGSGRMVGLTSFGEAAWSIEQVLNQRLAETQPGDADLYALLDKAIDVLGAWVNDLHTHGRSSLTPAALVAAANRVRQGEKFSYDASAMPMAVVDSAEDDDAPLLHDVQPAGLNDPLAGDAQKKILPSGFDTLAETDTPSFDGFEADQLTTPAAEMPLPALDVLDDFAPPDQKADDVVETITDIELIMPMPAEAEHVKRIGDLEISLPLHNIYLAETDELVRRLSHDIAEWRHEPERQVNIHAVHAAHSLAGSSATVGFKPLQEIAHALEQALQYLARQPMRLLPEDYDTLDYGIERIRFMLQLFALGEMPEHEPEQVQILQRLPEEIAARRSGQPTLVPTPSDPAEIDSTSAEALQHPVSIAPDSALSNELAAEPEVEPATASNSDALIQIETVSFAADFAANDEATQSMSADLDSSAEPTAASAPITELDLASEPLVTQPAEPSTPASMTPAIAPLLAKNEAPISDTSVKINDELDADLLPVFLEEGRDMLPQIGTAIRTWLNNPADGGAPQALLRFLHTIKGSARMAGAMQLGQYMHDLETRIEHIMRSGTPSPQALEDLLARHDHGLYLFEVLQNPDLQSPPTPAPDNDADAGVAANSSALVEVQALIPTGAINFGAVSRAGAAVSATAANAPLVRVRADILDRLVNQAGEVSISRSKLETDVGTLRGSLGELTENVGRLRAQLREIEMQAESQIASRMAHSPDREFDPLEFDRFTRLQELTRMMAESVSDVSSVQQNLARTVEGATAGLTTQARLTRDLQQDLMRVRMIQFASISERLYRVTRQAAKEIDKRVNLDIRGSGVEIDRSVLEKMAGPFEHLLRNAIVHGIETRDGRRAAGKNETGELLVEIRQEGNEVVIQFSDDGQGLNLTTIRNKAKSTGLLADDTELSDAEVTDLIFHPGFSTAEQVTELAGRGVGMDVVRAEATALGGRVAIKSELGKGAQFTIHLPLTLAVTQVVLLTSGGRTYAVPSVLVEQVQQLKTNPLAAAYNDGAVMWQGQRVSMHYLPALLGDSNATPVAQQYSPLIILKSGSDRVALHVDQIHGNREVVVKNIGPQLARMIGIAGATVLGSGEIVLILNPVPLAQRAAHENQRAPRLLVSDAPAAMGAVAEMGQPAQPPAAAPVQGLRTQPIVMVVDDSLTVRRVTQRLLVREGYQVVLAKDGVDALESLQSITPDVMLVDIEMPRMDGFDLTRNIRNDERTRHIPIIMITSRTASKHRNYAMELGVNEYLGKPYQEDALLKSIKGFLRRDVTVG